MLILILLILMSSTTPEVVPHTVPTFSAESGFCAKRLWGFERCEALPISVNATTRYEQLAVQYWNEQARTQIFEITEEQATIDFAPVLSFGADTLVGPGSYQDAFTSCTIRYDPHSVRERILAHELGHCLGFVDVVTTHARSHIPDFLNPRVCHDTEHPDYIPYSGIMSYCYDLERNVPEYSFHPLNDAWSLWEAGYINVGTLWRIHEDWRLAVLYGIRS